MMSSADPAVMQRQQSSISVVLEDYSLLRATNLITVLQGFGSHLRGDSLVSRTFTMQEADWLFARSRQVDSITYFMSHVWKDSQEEKWLALCLHFNLLGAMLASSIVVIIVKIHGTVIHWPSATFEDCGVAEVRYGPGCLIAGSLTFFLCVHFWHHMPVWMLGCREGTVFLDKLCVHQADADRKRAGILSFAAFIAKSKNVLCLWSPEYFSRLWCTLDMAAMVTSSNEGALPLIFLPLKLYKFAYGLCAVVAVARIGHSINNMTGRVIPADSIMSPMLCIVGALILSHATRQYLKDRMLLEKQLTTFSVESAGCVSEEDRAEVYQALNNWFGDLRTFNKLVRTQVRAHIVAAIGSEVHVPMILTAPFMLLQFFYYLDYAASGCYGFVMGELNTVAILQDLAWMFCLGSMLPLQLRIVTCISFFPGRWIVNCVATAVLAFAGGTILAAEYVLIYALMDSTEDRPIWPMALVVICCALWFLWLQKESFRCRVSAAHQVKASDTKSDCIADELPPIVSI